jgi:hypothetical protein
MNKQGCIYINTVGRVAECSGIGLEAFIKYSGLKIENIMLLKSEDMGNAVAKNFELLNGRQCVDRFIKNRSYEYGTLCFTDYSDMKDIERIEDNEISELLFIAHMFRPLNSPFIDAIGNSFIYISHDDDFYCKLYWKEQEYFIENILTNIIRNDVSTLLNVDLPMIDNEVTDQLVETTAHGLFIDFSEAAVNEGMIKIPIRIVGGADNYNDMRRLSENGIIKSLLFNYSKNMWLFY